MAMGVIKPPLQPAIPRAGGSYGTSPKHETATLTSENCNPNVDKEAGTPKRPARKETPVKPAKAKSLGETELGKSPVRRRVGCERSSPAKSPHKHFCRSPRCAANNPDYAVPAPRQYLKSKRHLLAVWQPPLNSKLKTSAASSSGSHHESEGVEHGVRGDHGEHTTCESDRQRSIPHMGTPYLVEEDVKEMDSTRSASPEDAPRTIVHHATESNQLINMSRFAATPQEAVKMANLDPEEYVTKCTPSRDGVLFSRVLVLNVKEVIKPMNSMCTATQDFKESNFDVKEDVKEQVPCVNPVSKSRDFDTSMRGVSASTSSVGDMSLASVEGIIGEIPITSAESRLNSLRSSKVTGSDFSSASDFRRLSLRPPQRRYFRKGGRRLSNVRNHSISLHKQEGLKRKKDEDWMWDTAIKEAVHRLAPRVPGSVNLLVKAFESVKLTEAEIQRDMSKIASVGRLVFKDLPFGLGASAPDVETISSIQRVQAWDEPMASVDLGPAGCERAEEGISVTPKKSQETIPLFSSNSEPPRVQSSRWATASDESMTAKDDAFSDKGPLSTSGKSRMTEWTCDRKSQAGRPHKQKLKRCTSLHPFRLRTEERGAMKEYVFSRRLQEMWEEEERLRIPLAQGLPWTTEEPAVPPKPPVKEQTRPEGFKLITDVRAVERAEFDEYMAERQKREEMQQLEEERQRQIAEVEEVRRLRREMVPRAQLMPYFDRPFMPGRSSKNLTVPKEPKFHFKQSKRPRCLASCSSSAA